MKRMLIHDDRLKSTSLLLKAMFFLLPVLLNAQGTGGTDESRPRGGIVEIQTPISTEFGTYIPYRVPVYEASVGFSEARLQPDFSNVTAPRGGFSWGGYFTASERAALGRDRLAVRPEPMATFGQAYAGMSAQPEFAPFITADAAMAGLRATTDEAYRRAQRDYLAPSLRSVLDELSRNLSAGLSGESDSELKNAFRGLLAWSETARLLLDPAASPNATVADQVREELRRIDAGAAAESRVLPDRRIDYGIFVPTGHYAAVNELRSYYRAKTWLSRVGLQLGSAEETRMALLLARSLDLMGTREKNALGTVAGLEHFFAGRDANALTPDAVAAGMRAYYGFQYTGGVSYLSDEGSLERLFDYLGRSLPENMLREENLTMRVLPRESGIADALYTSLRRARGVSAGQYGSILVEALQRAEGSESNDVRNLRSTLARLPMEDWVQDLDWTTLYTAQLIAAEEESNGLPAFMRSNGWKERKAASALGVWSAVLNGPGNVPTSVSGTMETGSAGTAGFHAGYVEPDPAAWSAIASQARYIREGLTGGTYGGVIGGGLEDKFRDIENSAVQFARIAAQELAGRELTAEQSEVIAAAPQHIAAWETFVDASLRGDGTPVTASSRARSGAVGPATGHPMAIYVIVPAPGDPAELVLMRGAVYSYHETGMGEEEWVRAVTTPGSDAGAYVVPVSEVRPVQARLSRVTSAVRESERRSATGAVQVDLEANVVRRSSGAVWYTVFAPGYDGADVITTVVDAAGRQIFQSFPLPIENGQRYDMVPTDDMRGGHYFIRVSDITGRTLASGRFLLVQ